MSLAERIKKWREWAGLTPTMLADECHVTTTAVYHWELGNTEPTHGNVERIAKAVGVSIPMFWSDVPRLKKAVAS
jgi:transcriptional regulator with XRE-family HTH domain